MPLTVDRFGERGLLPAGGYALEVRREDGRRSTRRGRRAPGRTCRAGGRAGPARAATGRHRAAGHGRRRRPALPGPQRPRPAAAAGRGLPSRTAGHAAPGDRAARDLPRPQRRRQPRRGRPGPAGLRAGPAAASTSPSWSTTRRSSYLPARGPSPGARVPGTTRSLGPRSTSPTRARRTGSAKSPGQLHVQTWHGTPLKRIGEDRGPGDFATWRHRRRIADQARGWDAMVSPSPYCSEIYRSAFGYDGTILEVGYPRNDVLLAPDADVLRERVRRRLGIGAGRPGGALRADLAPVRRRARREAALPRRGGAGAGDAGRGGAGARPLQQHHRGRRLRGRIPGSTTSPATPTSPTCSWPRTRWSPTTPR